MIAPDILRMIETVPISDATLMDLIDEAVYSYIDPVEIPSLDFNGNPFPKKAPRYTCSRDALKLIMPSCEYSYRIDGGTRSGFYNCKFSLCNFETTVISLPTEELAVSHAIIQCIEHERGGK